MTPGCLSRYLPTRSRPRTSSACMRSLILSIRLRKTWRRWHFSERLVQPPVGILGQRVWKEHLMSRRGTAASINLAELEKLAAMQCTDEEIAGWFGVSTRTIERRRKSRVFAEVIERGKAKGRISLRRSQLRILEEGSAVMGIFLGKQYLGQRDQLDIGAPQIVAIVMPSGAPPAPQNSIPDADDVVEIEPMHQRQLT